MILVIHIPLHIDCCTCGSGSMPTVKPTSVRGRGGDGGAASIRAAAPAACSTNSRGKPSRKSNNAVGARSPLKLRKGFDVRARVRCAMLLGPKFDDTTRASLLVWRRLIWLHTLASMTLSLRYKASSAL